MVQHKLVHLFLELTPTGQITKGVATYAKNKKRSDNNHGVGGLKQITVY
jgi:hypothetical protein